ncbi:MAG: HEAT repeat domain-containing protein [Planctomycetes bacterium]|nr:HEAT repeat domain-containing protein [Planctomycetota bacterium]
MGLQPARIFVLFAWILAGATGLARADTVYLKNGSWIDGIVKTRSSSAIQVEIGEIGRIEIPLEDVYEIEKNSRTGSTLSVPVEGRKLGVEVKSGKAATPSDASQPVATLRSLPAAASGEEMSTAPADKEPRAGDQPAGSVVDEAAQDIDPSLKKRIEQLVEDLCRQKSKYRVRAERQLKAVGPAAIPFLQPLASHESDLVRVAVFKLFFAMGDEDVIDPSIEALTDSNEYVRDFAHKALQRITEEDFGYRPFANPSRREQGKRKWRRWWDEEQKQMGDLKTKASEKKEPSEAAPGETAKTLAAEASEGADSR